MIQGVLQMLGGLRLLVLHRELQPLLWRILALLLALLLVLGGGVFWLADVLAQHWLPQGDAWYWQLISWVVWILAFMLAFMSGIVGFSMLGSVAAAPWLDALAARAERMHGARIDAPRTSTAALVFRSLGNAVRPLLVLAGFAVLTLLLMWIPGIGQIAAAVVWTYGGIRFLNFELMDTPASRHGWDYAARKREMAEKRQFYLGFGGTAFVLMMVPLLNVLVLPAAVVALSRRYAEAGRA